MSKPTTKRSAKQRETSAVAEETVPIASETGIQPETDPVGAVSVNPIDPVTGQFAPQQKTKSQKPRKPKLVRDSFKIPENEYEAIGAMKTRCLECGVAVKKSELLRAGLLALQALNNQKLLKLIGKLEKIKTGRPAS